MNWFIFFLQILEIKSLLKQIRLHQLNSQHFQMWIINKPKCDVSWRIYDRLIYIYISLLSFPSTHKRLWIAFPRIVTHYLYKNNLWIGNSYNNLIYYGETTEYKSRFRIHNQKINKHGSLSINISYYYLMNNTFEIHENWYFTLSLHLLAKLTKNNEEKLY